VQLSIRLPGGDQRVAVTGSAERNLKLIREALGVTIVARNGALGISGESDAVAKAARVVERLSQAARDGRPMSHQAVLETLAEVARGGGEVRPAGPPPRPAPPVVPPTGFVREPDGEADGEVDGGELVPVSREGLDVYLHGRRVRAMTEGQAAYLDAIAGHDLTFCCGPAGTGKTFLAVAAAVSMFKAGHIRKLVLVRPAVEAGEKLGFLPGTMQDKVNPYLRPLLDALHDLMEFDQIERFMAADLIEIIPLAFMRGRTLNDACVILDEAQNTTRSQMLMFLTRMGHGSKMIVTGDTSQIDLEDPRDSGLVDAVRRLGRVNGVATTALDRTDIVRHALVQRIVQAYGEPERRPEAENPADNPPARG